MVVLKFSVQVRFWTLFRHCAMAESAFRALLTMHVQKRLSFSKEHRVVKNRLLRGQ